MRLLDTNVLVYARSVSSPFKKWAEEQIAEAVSTEGAALNAVSLAELCAEPGIDSSVVARTVTSFGVQIVDVPAAAAARCGEAYRLVSRSTSEGFRQECSPDSPAGLLHRSACGVVGGRTGDK